MTPQPRDGVISTPIRYVRKLPAAVAAMTDNAPVIDADLCYEAVRSRDARFDGRFFTAVRTTGIYCRPICPSRTPKRENVDFFTTPAAAEAGGFRPCLRCRPETAPGTPAWQGTSTTVARAMRLIEEADGEIDVQSLAARLGMTDRHLRRLFLEHLGTTPIGVIQTQRAHLARRLLRESAMPMSDVAFASGFSSIRRFNDAMQKTYGCTPGALRRDDAPTRSGAITLTLQARAPIRTESLFAFLRGRAIEGVDVFEDAHWRRATRAGEWRGVVDIHHSPDGAIAVTIPPAGTRQVHAIVARTRRALDVGADADSIADHLSRDPVLRPLVRRMRGIRVPQAWEPFETAIRAIVGQQVSVAAATTIMSRLTRQYGEPIGDGFLLFPSAQQLAEATITGMPRARAATVQAMAKALIDDPHLLERGAALEEKLDSLCSIRGIGPWTASYIAMRVVGEPDAFPFSDLGLRKAAEALGINDLAAHAEQWRPWRAYAAMILWESLK